MNETVMMQIEKKKAHRTREKRKSPKTGDVAFDWLFFSFFSFFLLLVLILPLLFHHCSHKKEGMVGI